LAEAILARGEIFTLFSDMIQRGAGQNVLQRSFGPSKAVSRRPVRARLHRNLAAMDHLGERTVVLRTLIEEFGGEVVSSTLRRRLLHLVTWKEAEADLWLRGVLDELEQCGALSLENVNWTDVIARIKPSGVSLAYDLTTSALPGGEGA
jgi:hypothetical protein